MDATQQRYADQTIGARDSAILDMLLSLGWLGALLYGSSLVVLYFAQRRYPGQDSFSHASRAIFDCTHRTVSPRKPHARSEWSCAMELRCAVARVSSIS